MSRILAGWVSLLFLLMCSLPAAAQPEQEPAPIEDPKVAEAKEAFRKGVELFGAGDLERALEHFSRSRSIFPSVQNTSNAAICLDELGRYDEALELYELVLTEFKAELTDRERESLGPAMAKLRERVGSLWVSANVDGSLVVDGRARSELPLTIAVRLLPGKRLVRVLADGYVTFERTVLIEATKTARVEARLEPLRDAGLLRVEDPEAPGSLVFVDGAKMGPTPWEGTLGPGRHVISTRKGDLGSAPKSVVVVQGQKAVVQVPSAPLGRETQISARPASAALEIDGVLVSHGAWRGRLPLGTYAVRAFEDGYHQQKRQVVIAAQTERAPLAFDLAVDEAHPRWPKGAEGALFIEAAAGYELGASFTSGAESNCRDCPAAPLVHGLSVSARGGYRFAPGVSLELVVGYMRLHSSFDRTVDGGAASPYQDLTYALHDALLVHGPFGGFGVGYRLPFADRFAFSARVMGGAMLASASDDIDASASTGGESTPATVRDDNPVGRVGTIFVQGDMGLAVVVGQLDIGLVLAAQVFVLDGPVLDQRRLDVAYACDPTGPRGVGCIESGVPLADEVAHSTFALGSPQLRIGYSF